MLKILLLKATLIFFIIAYVTHWIWSMTCYSKDPNRFNEEKEYHLKHTIPLLVLWILSTITTIILAIITIVIW